MASHPLISIIVPTFNSQRYLNECLRSIKFQSERDYQVIFVDKGSTDSTLSIISSYDFSNVLILRQCSDSLPGALHEGFCAASGDILCWLNSDDMYARPDVLETIKKRFTRQSNVDYFVYGNFLLIDSRGLVTNLVSSHWRLSRFQRAAGSANICTGALFFSRELYKGFGCIDQGYKVGFEYPLIDYLFANGNPGFEGIYMQAYRIHDQQLSAVREACLSSDTIRIDSSLPRATLAARFKWRIFRFVSRVLYSNPFHRQRWIGRHVSDYWIFCLRSVSDE